MRANLATYLIILLISQLCKILMALVSSLQSSDVTLDKFFSSDSSSKKTIIGFGSLMSQTSSRLTFPELTNFRTVKVKNIRRLFLQPAAVFFERGIADLSTNRIASLTTEEDTGSSFLAVAFDVSGVTGDKFLLREEEFNFKIVPFEEIDPLTGQTLATTISHDNMNVGVLCTSSSDDIYKTRWGESRFNERYRRYGIHTIWGYDDDSGILPCSVYLRHCYLASKSLGQVVHDSFLNDTFLCDRKTSVKQYLTNNPEVLDCLPPESLVGRYSG